MIDRMTLLFALPGFRVLNVSSEPDVRRLVLVLVLVLVESLAQDGGCPFVWGDVRSDQGPPGLPVEGPTARECAACRCRVNTDPLAPSEV